MADYQKPKKPQIYLNSNYRKEPGDNQPSFNGNIAFSWNPDEKRKLAAWLNLAKPQEGQPAPEPHPELGMPHTVSLKLAPPAGAQMLAQTDPNHKARGRGKSYTLPGKDGGKDLLIEPDTGVLFINKSRNDQHPNASHYYGYVNPGDDKPLQRVGLWQDLDRSGQVMFSGPVEDYDASRERALNEASSPPPEVGRREEEMELSR